MPDASNEQKLFRRPRIFRRLPEMGWWSRRWGFRPRLFFLYFPVFASITVLVISLTQMILWLSPEESLRLIAGRNMKFNTSLGLFALSLGMILIFLSQRFFRLGGLSVLVVCVSPFVFLLGLMSGLQYLFSVDFLIDQLFIRDVLLGGSSQHPGRMAPQTAICFLSMGATLTYMSVSKIRKTWVEQILVAPASAVAALALIGYAYRYPNFYQVSSFVQIGEWTAFSFLLLSVSVYCLKPRFGVIGQLSDEEIIGPVARRLALATLGIPFFVGWLVVALETRELLSGIPSISLFMVGNILGFGTLIFFALRTLKRVDSQRSEAIEALRLNKERATFLADSSKVLSSSLDFNQTTENLARLAVDYISDWCVIDLADERGNFKRFAAVHRSPEKAELMKKLASYPPLLMEDQMLRRAIETRETILFRNADVGQIESLMPDVERRELWLKIGVKSGVLLPLHARNRIIGLISFVKSEDETGYGPEDVPLLEEFARRASYAIDNSVLYRRSQEAIELRDEFFSIASHELKTPISALSLHLQLMRRMLRSSESIEDLRRVFGSKMKDMDRQMDRLTALIENLLDLSRLRSGKIKLDPEYFDFAEMLREVVARTQPMARHRGIKMSLTANESVFGWWDRFRMEQIINNLLTNAVKYGEHKPIDIDLSSDGKRLRVSVKDRGVGIPSRDQQKIFDRFERSVHSSQVSGLGLGLYIVSEFVKAHQGRIELSSELNKGSCFRLEFPIFISQEDCLRLHDEKREMSDEREIKVANSSG
ncbi:MAG: sensor histidine kinase [Bradymonadales bacterium]|nr:MAG: sensor histidine kinase [Bradymonadales bacterium]